MDLILDPINKYNKGKPRNKRYEPDKHFFIGNHEERMVRHVNANPELEGMFSYDDFELEQRGWKGHVFLKIKELDGVHYSHYFQTGIMGRPVSSMIESAIKTIGFSFSMGHQQVLKYGVLNLPNGDTRHGLVAGSYYQHEEGYMKAQGNKHWRGLVLKNEVVNGSYDPAFLSMKYMLREWT